MLTLLTSPTFKRLIKNNVYGQQLNIVHCVCAVVHNEQATGTDDIEVKTLVSFQQIAVEMLKELAY